MNIEISVDASDPPGFAPKPENLAGVGRGTYLARVASELGDAGLRLQHPNVRPEPRPAASPFVYRPRREPDPFFLGRVDRLVGKLVSAYVQTTGDAGIVDVLSRTATAAARRASRGTIGTRATRQRARKAAC